jgi:hypothetical protein
MKNKILMGLAAVAMVAFLSSCGKVPQAKIDAANAAIDSAKVVEATVYVPAELAAVQDSMKAVTAAVEVQKSKMFKNFKKIEVKLDETLAAARKVQVDAVAKKAEVKKEVETLMTDCKAVCDDNAKLFKKAPRGKDSAPVLEAMKAEMATIDATCGEAKALYDKGAFMDALNKMKVAKDSSDKINTELKDAIAKVSGAKKAAAKPAAKPAVKK